MRADPRFLSRSPRFWAQAKYISEKLKYSDRNKQLRAYEAVQVVAALRDRNLTPDNDLIKDVLEYLQLARCQIEYGHFSSFHESGGSS
ncbi:MAG: hypothetical protein ABI196_08485 [Bradyrhizobium sp.]